MRILLMLIVVFSIPSSGLTQSGWRIWNYSFGFGRLGIMQNELSEEPVFNPFIQFDVSYNCSLWHSLGLKSTLAHTSYWVYSRADFQKVNGRITVMPQDDFKLNSYYRFNSIGVGVGPQLKLYERLGNNIYLSTLYTFNYQYRQLLQYKVENVDRTFGENYNDRISPLRHGIQLELNVIRSGPKVSGFFNCFTLLGGLDLNSYGDGGKFRPVYIGLTFGI